MDAATKAARVSAALQEARRAMQRMHKDGYRKAIAPARDLIMDVVKQEGTTIYKAMLTVCEEAKRQGNRDVIGLTMAAAAELMLSEGVTP